MMSSLFVLAVALALAAAMLPLLLSLVLSGWTAKFTSNYFRADQIPDLSVMDSD